MLNPNISPLFTKRACRFSCSVLTATKKLDMLPCNKTSTPLSLPPNVLQITALQARQRRQPGTWQCSQHIFIEVSGHWMSSSLKIIKSATNYQWEQGEDGGGWRERRRAYPTRSPYGLGLQLWHQHLAVLRRNGSDDVDQTWLRREPILGWSLGFQPESRNTSNSWPHPDFCTHSHSSSITLLQFSLRGSPHLPFQVPFFKNYTVIPCNSCSGYLRYRK